MVRDRRDELADGHADSASAVCHANLCSVGDAELDANPRADCTWRAARRLAAAIGRAVAHADLHPHVGGPKPTAHCRAIGQDTGSVVGTAMLPVRSCLYELGATGIPGYEEHDGHVR